MKICFISNLYSPWVIGGAEIYVESIAKALSSRHEVIIITSRSFNGIKSMKPEIYIQDKIKMYRFYPANVYHTYYAKHLTDVIKPIWHMIDIWNPHSYFVIRSILEKERPDIVHTHNLGGISPSALDAAKRCKIPVVHTIHDYSFICPRATLIHERSNDICSDPKPICMLYRELKKKTTDKMDAVTSPSKFVIDTFEDAGFFASSPLMISMPLGIDVIPKSKRKLKSTIDFLYIGQIVKHKGVDILIKAFKEMPTENINLHIAGTGPHFDEIKKIADDPRIILHGFISSEEKEELFSIADLCIVPSTWFENSPVVIYESIFRGVPVVGSRIGGIPELIKEGYNGQLFEPGNPAELRAILQHLITHPDELERLGQGALESAKDYSMQRHIDRLEDLYQSLLKSAFEKKASTAGKA